MDHWLSSAQPQVVLPCSRIYVQQPQVTLRSPAWQRSATRGQVRTSDALAANLSMDAHACWSGSLGLKQSI